MYLLAYELAVHVELACACCTHLTVQLPAHGLDIMKLQERQKNMLLPPFCEPLLADATSLLQSS